MNNMCEVLARLQSEGVKTLDIYFAEDINAGDERWFVDVMQDNVNDRARTNWTWTVISKKELEKEKEDDEDIFKDEEEEFDWQIVVDEPFSDSVVEKAIGNWLKERNLEFAIKIIPLDEARGSGYVKDLRERIKKT